MFTEAWIPPAALQSETTPRFLYRLYRRAASDAKNKVSLPTVSNPKTLAQLIAAVEPERIVTDEQLAHPDTSVRDPRIAAASGYTWFFDGRCCGGNHKYRFHLDKSGDAEFVVMDYDDTHHENILAKGRWFTVGNIGLHIVLNGKYFNYLYTAGERTMSSRNIFTQQDTGNNETDYCKKYCKSSIVSVNKP